MNKSILLTLFCVILFGCSTTKSIKFSQKKDEIVNTESLRDFLSKNKKPKVVLRVNESTLTVTENENVDYLFNAIENQLLQSGFIVRDRQLFNQIIKNNDNNFDYSMLKDKADTDLIIELTKLNPQVLYETNKYYDRKNREKIDPVRNFKRYGATVEFKVVMINTNEFAGVYQFNYTPCLDGCIISQSLWELEKKRNSIYNQNVEGYEGVEKDELEVFIKDATKRLVSEMRK